MAGFSYGPRGNTHYTMEGGEMERGYSDPLSDSIDDIPIPPQFNEDGQPSEEQKSENRFWKGIMVGIAVWVGVVISLLSAYFLCKKNSVVSAESHSQYQNLPSS